MATDSGNVQGVASESDLLGVVALASNPLPNRPDGTVVTIQYSSNDDYTCKTIDQEFDRLSIQHPDCVFLRCYKEYQGAPITMTSRGITNLPTFEVFYKGAPVAKVDGSRISEVQDYIKQFGFVVSKTDFFSSNSPYQEDGRRPQGRSGDENNPWDNAADAAARSSRKEGSAGPMKAPRTTQRYFPGAMMGTEAAKNVEGGSMMDLFQQERRRPKPGGGSSITGDTGPGIPFGMGDAPPGARGEGKEGPGPGPRGPERDAAEDALNRMWDDYK